MKRSLLFLSLLLSIAATAQFGWNSKRVDGSGNITRQTRKVANFTAISNSGPWDVMISDGDGGAVEVEGDDNLLEYIETKVEDGKLYVRSARNVNIRSSKRITVYVSMSTIRELALSGSGDIIGKGRFNTDGTVNARVSGSGKIKLDFGRFSTLETRVSGSGSITMKGTSDNVDAHISGSGNIDCYDVVSDNARGKVSGSGNIKMNANVSIDGSINGSGNIYYRGGAKNVHTHRSGSGRMVKG